ncbi:threonylcarbamoyl-AMP synthase [Hylaeus volcanicus]|uniref:threonylcarbamoyl-AMP synthase n=1 Tax=Hylaeus volcanicus TaxID=313075 RepID=UPI0023B83CD4|nr:threonylcarbamoyl-AMP synthase [Hylaeus volcanicus]
MNAAMEQLQYVESSEKHWICKGKRSLAIAATLLNRNEIVAIPTDTVYGLAGIINNTESIKKLYEIKGRNEKKPISISVSSVADIKHWGYTDHLPPNLLPAILPGPYTVVLERTPDLNPFLNPGISTVGIRVPKFKFINCLSNIVGPLALTSANLSNEPSCLNANEFEILWPKLGGIFYDSRLSSTIREVLRKGSTIVDLTCPYQYRIIRKGVGMPFLTNMLSIYGLKMVCD